MLEHFEASVVAATRSATWLGGGKALFPGGRNGPYLDLESPVRNSAHWLAALSIAHQLGVPGAERVGVAVTEFLLGDHPFSRDGRVVHRQRAGKDWCNGIIGDAWVIEALALSGRLLDHQEAAASAARSAAAHPFASPAAGWSRVDPGGGRRTPDRTLNHQLWFAAAAREAATGRPEAALVHPRVNGLLTACADGAFSVRADGRIEHHLRPPTQSAGMVGPRARRSIRTIRDRPRRRAHHAKEREDGYHLYVLFALARLRATVPDHAVWHRPQLEAALQAATDPALLDRLADNPYAFGYNAPGFELPLIATMFVDLAPGLTERVRDAWQEQVSRTWDAETATFSRGTADPLTLSARVYELGLGLLRMAEGDRATTSAVR